MVAMSADPTIQIAEPELESLRRRVAELEDQLLRERANETSREQLASMLAYVPDTVYMIDRQGKLLYLNRVRGSLKLEDVLASSAYDFICPEHQARFRETVEHVFATGQPGRCELYASDGDGGWCWYSCFLGPVWQEGRVVAAAGAATDVDDFKRTQQALQVANADLEGRVAERTRDLEQANAVLRREAAQRIQAEQEVEEQGRLLGLVLDSMDVGVVIADRQGRITRINPAAAKIIGGDSADAAAFERRWHEATFLPDGGTPSLGNERPLVKAARGEPIEGEEILFMHPEQWEGIWLQVTARPLIDRTGARYGAVLLFRNITLQKRALTALRETEQRFFSILENTPAIVYIKDASGKYLLVNRALEDAFGLASEEIVGRTDAELFDSATAEQFRENDRKVLRSGLPFQFEETVPVRGTVRTYLSVKFALPDARQSPYALCGISTEISERKQSEERLRSEQAFLKQLIRAHEHDRQLMAYEIHDGLVQYMSASLMHLDCVATEKQISDKGQGSLELARHLVRRSVAEGRRVMSGLRPPILDEEGIVLAIHYLIAEQHAPGELDIQFEHQVTFDRLDPLLEGTLFRITQEALTNIKRHSRAMRAEVKLLEQGQRIHLTIRDWGTGFDPSQVSDERFGLQGIRKRADLLGGQAQIVSAPGEGTTITVSLPLASAMT